MSYNTEYKLNAAAPPFFEDWDTVTEAMKAFKPEGGTEWLYYIFMHGEKCKWYSWEEDMREFSCLFPDIFFMLEGKGEDPGDLWKAYFKNGKMQLCDAEITYPPYDENKLE